MRRMSADNRVRVCDGSAGARVLQAEAQAQDGAGEAVEQVRQDVNNRVAGS